MTENETKLDIHILPFKRYRMGMPMFVSVTLQNATSGAEYYNIPDCSPLAAPFPIKFTVASSTERIILPSASAQDNDGGFDLLPGEARTYLMDISELQRTIPVGEWTIEAEWSYAPEMPHSSPTLFEVFPSTDQDVLEVSRLRKRNAASKPYWSDFLLDNARTIFADELMGISADSYREISPYLFLHRAIYGPLSPAELPIDSFDSFTESQWTIEAELLRYECLVARGSADAVSFRESLLSKWPGLIYRLDNIFENDCSITELRKFSGRDARKYNNGTGPYDDNRIP